MPILCPCSQKQSRAGKDLGISIHGTGGDELTTQEAAAVLPRGMRAPLPHRTFGWRTVLGIILALPVVAVTAEACHVLFGQNFHVVVPGRVYRCSQRSGADLEALIRAHHVATVINLRGNSFPMDWYVDESRATHRLNVSQEDICMSAGRFPSVHEIRYLLDVLDQSDYPILLHCRQGADRTGLICAMILLLQTDGDLRQARHQLSLRYGHIALGRPAYLDRLIDNYEHWLQKGPRSHSPANFREWLTSDDCPGEAQCRLQPLHIPDVVPVNTPVAFQVRAHNIGLHPWRFHPGNNSGVHATYVLQNAQYQSVAQGNAGLFDAMIPPRSSIDLTFALPSLPQPGLYRLFVDMVDAPHCFFYQAGSEHLEKEFAVAP